MERIAAVLERERELLEVLLFKLVETRLILESGDARFLARSTREVERARGHARDLDLVRAATVAHHRPGATLRTLAGEASGPWPTILRDHHERLVAMVSEIEVTAHQNAVLAGADIHALAHAPVCVPAEACPPDDDLARLARGAALETVMGTASRLQMPDLLDFLR